MSTARVAEFFLSKKGSIAISFLGTLFGLVKNYLCQEQDRYGYPKSKITFHKKIIRSDTNVENEVLKLKNIGMITHQSFQDLGFKGPLIVEFSKCNILASTYSFPHKGKIGAVVTYEYPEILTYSPEQMYAIAGHEAIHIQHQHSSLFKNAAWCGVNLGFLSYFTSRTYKQYISLVNMRPISIAPVLMNAVFLFACANIILKGFDKLCEIDADIISAKHLGTAKPLSEINQRWLNEKSAQSKSKRRLLSWLLSTHPSDQTRIQYLKYVDSNSEVPKLFNSQIYQQIQKEKNQPLLKKDLHQNEERVAYKTVYFGKGKI